MVIEQLDFNKKKQQLAFNTSAKRCRQLSSFTYAAIINTIKSKAFKHALEVFQVNPAYTSVIGRIKFARIYKISVHQSAAMVIARRLYDFSEALPNCWDNIPDDTGGRVTLSELAKIPHKHVWSTWAVVRKNLQAALAAQYQKLHQFGKNHIDLTCDLAF